MSVLPGAGGPLGERALDWRRAVTDTVVPTVLFAVLAATQTLGTAAVGALGWCALVIVVRLLRRDELLYAFSGLGGVVIGVALALWTDDAETFFLPGILGNAATATVCLVSVLVRRPALAYASAALTRWPLGWYLHDRVRPAYSEVTWLWVAYYGGKAGWQAWLVQRDDLAALATVRILTGWPTLIGLVALTYAYLAWRLPQLGGPSVGEWEAETAPG